MAVQATENGHIGYRLPSDVHDELDELTQLSLLDLLPAEGQE